MRLHQLTITALLAAVTLILAPVGANAMTFERVDGAQICRTDPCVLATGEIDTGTAGEFKAFLHKSDVHAGATVVFDSPGGVLLESLALGRVIREAGLYTAIGRYDREKGEFTTGASCVSACAYAFLGGVQRDVAAKAHFGVHQFSADPAVPDSISVADAQALMGLISIYMNRMVGNSSLLVLAAATPPSGSHWLSSRELRNCAVVTQ
jgi:hypothetical protein